MTKHYAETHTRKIDPTPISILAKHDTLLNLYYVEDDICIEQHQINILRKTNLDFLKILKDCGVFVISAQNQWYWKTSVNFEDIKRITNYIFESYKYNLFTDSDLHDDIFDQFDIVTPNIAYNNAAKLEYINNYLHNFSTLKDCETFINDRARLFCLYIFLRRCAILARDTIFSQPLELLFTFLSNRKNLTKFGEDYLRVKSVFFAGDYWGTGLHEWLTCSDTLEALIRSAGRRGDVEPCIKAVAGQYSRNNEPATHFVFSEFNWLDFQFLIRTPTKHIIFGDFSGHPGAVYGDIVPTKDRKRTKGKGQKVELSNLFHAILNTKFSQETSISGYLFKIADLYLKHVLNDTSTYINPTSETKYISKGYQISNQAAINFFKNIELVEPRENIEYWVRDIFNQIILNSLGNNDKVIYIFHEDKIIPPLYQIERSTEIRPSITNIR